MLKNSLSLFTMLPKGGKGNTGSSLKPFIYLLSHLTPCYYFSCEIYAVLVIWEKVRIIMNSEDIL
jgi:hypothetical protein